MDSAYVNKHDLSIDQVYIFNEGIDFRSYFLLGARPHTMGGEKGYRFVVWAPHARAVHLVGEFNGWDTSSHPMGKVDKTGLWYIFVPGIIEGAIYKYYITTRANAGIYKSDPFGFFFRGVSGECLTHL